MRKELRIYLPFAANELKRQLAYKGAFYLFILVHLFGSFISYYLWMAIYGSSEKEVIGGLTTIVHVGSENNGSPPKEA